MPDPAAVGSIQQRTPAIAEKNTQIITYAKKAAYHCPSLISRVVALNLKLVSVLVKNETK
jgi:hypothetical protein